MNPFGAVLVPTWTEQEFKVCERGLKGFHRELKGCEKELKGCERESNGLNGSLMFANLSRAVVNGS